MTMRGTWMLVAGMMLVQAAVLHLLGRVWICE